MSLPITPDPTSPTDTPTTPDPAATCGMPDRPLSPPSSGASSAARIRPSPPRARGVAGGEALPLADRCWELFCAGKSYTAIGRILGIDRETAARHIKAIHAEVQAERRADRTLALSRALATQQRIQATGWDLLALAQAQLQPSSPLPAGEGSGVRSSGSPPRARGRAGGEASLADCARLLNIILASARETARLELLYDKDAPARRAEQGPPEPVHIIIERVGDPYVDPTQPSAPVPPPAPTSTPPDTSPPPSGRPDPGDVTSNNADPADPAGPASPDGACSPPRAGEELGERSVSRTTPLAHPGLAVPFTARAAPSTPLAPAAQPAPEPPSPTWISLGDGSMAWGTSTPPSRAHSGPSELGKGSGMRSASGSPPRARGGAGGEEPSSPPRARGGAGGEEPSSPPRARGGAGGEDRL